MSPFAKVWTQWSITLLNWHQCRQSSLDRGIACISGRSHMTSKSGNSSHDDREKLIHVATGGSAHNRTRYLHLGIYWYLHLSIYSIY